MTTGPTDTGPADTGPTDTGARPPRRPRPLELVLVVVAVVLAASVGATWWRDRSDDFCGRVGELPSISSTGSDGTPARALAASASAYEGLARSAGDERIASAARTFADHQRSLADAVAGNSSSTEVVEQVRSLDDPSLARAREVLDAEIARRCS